MNEPQHRPASLQEVIESEKIRYDFLFERGIDFRGRSIVLSGDIQPGDFEHIDAAMSELERDGRAAITIKICSPGGSVYDALAIVGRLKASKCRIITEGYGQVMSAATLILASGDKRKMSRFAFFMAHQSSYGLSGSHAEIREEVDQMEREEKIWSGWMSDFTETDVEYWYHGTHKTNLYLTAEECLALGVVDEII